MHPLHSVDQTTQQNKLDSLNCDCSDAKVKTQNSCWATICAMGFTADLLGTHHTITPGNSHRKLQIRRYCRTLIMIQLNRSVESRIQEAI